MEHFNLLFKSTFQCIREKAVQNPLLKFVFEDKKLFFDAQR